MRGESFVSYLQHFIGVKGYWPRWDQPGDNSESKPMQGNDDPILGFTCSGFVSMGLRREFLDLRASMASLSVAQLRDHFTANVIWKRGSAPMPQTKPGDLIFYGSSAADVYHVAVVSDARHIIEVGGLAPGVDTPREQAAKNAFVQESPIEFRASERQALIRLWED